MAFDANSGRARRVAVIGGGISGLACAWLLSRTHHVTLFEKDYRLGGHARTVLAGRNGDQWVDTGFIVYNYVTYPHLTRLFRDLDVPVERSCMSFAVSVGEGRLEYALRTLDTVFGQRRNLFNPRFHGLLRDIQRFNARAEQAAAGTEMSLEDLVVELGLGDWFRDYYLRPMCAAIWSTPSGRILDFPAEAMLRFFRNHALLAPSGQHQWWTVSGGSRTYVQRLEAALRERDVEIRTGTGISAVERLPESVRIMTQADEPQSFDEVVFACHSDVALKLLSTPSGAERQALGAIRFQENRAVLHRDTAQMPARRRCWASWAVRAGEELDDAPVGITYWMNRLQNIPDDDPLFVTLNPARQIADELIYDQTDFSHPIFDRAALEAQKRIAKLQGQNRTWFAGAWLRNGFHEDGFASAVRVADQLCAMPVGMAAA